MEFFMGTLLYRVASEWPVKNEGKMRRALLRLAVPVLLALVVFLIDAYFNLGLLKNIFNSVDALAELIFTTGTTGKPKGATLTRRGVEASAKIPNRCGMAGCIQTIWSIRTRTVLSICWGVRMTSSTSAARRYLQ